MFNIYIIEKEKGLTVQLNLFKKNKIKIIAYLDIYLIFLDLDHYKNVQ